MQEVKNKLAMFNTLRCADLAATDLKLLAKRCPQHPDMARFMFSPERNADDILFSLLDHATEDEILENRMENEQEKIGENDGTPETDNEGGTPPNGDDDHIQTEDEGGTPLNGDDGHIQTEGEDEQTADGNNDETSDGQSSNIGNGTEGENGNGDKPTETDGEQPSAATGEKGESEQADEPQAVPQDKAPKAKDAKKK